MNVPLRYETAKVDCNTEHLPHVWSQVAGKVIGLVAWFTCIAPACPVSTRTLRASVTAEMPHPDAFLGDYVGGHR